MAEIEIDGKKIEVEDGTMVIEAADNAGIPIPRFCYHKKLSIAANCRMCLVEVEKSPKPMPACATPVMDGMRIYTKSPTAIAAQKSVMEFLLINHPLDCPICDQGGECELQDVSLEYGDDVSRYNQGKRSVDDKNIGPLISTDMTRCIHCTRCVRFGEEIAGVAEMGATNRGEHMEIGTYVKHSLRSELSGNMIDVCPVGALTSKPYRFKARAWELSQQPAISPHDCVGSHLNIHTRRNEVMRVVPKENESINETWISDRDRFSYTGLSSRDRITQPWVKKGGQWQATDWQTALTAAINGIKTVIETHGVDQVAGVASPSSTTEELFLFQKVLRGLKVRNIDHRLHQMDFSDQEHSPVTPHFDCSLEEIENQQSIFVIGANLAKEQPLINHRLRKASLKQASIHQLNACAYDFNFPCQNKLIIKPADWVKSLAMIVIANGATISSLPSSIQDLVKGEESTEIHKAIAEQLKRADKVLIMLGSQALNHPHASALRYLTTLLAKHCQAKWVSLTDSSNHAGASLAGALPHRSVNGAVINKPGLDAYQCFEKPQQCYVLLNVEPELDCANPSKAMRSLQTAEFVVVLSPYKTEAMERYADVILPMASFTETAGSYVNCQGDWQSFKAAVNPLGEVRPAWKILRVMGNLFNIEGFDYSSCHDVQIDLREIIEKSPNPAIDYNYEPAQLKTITGINGLTAWPMYRNDALVRRSKSLQEVGGIEQAAIYVATNVAQQHNLSDGATIKVTQDGQRISLPVIIDARLADDTAFIPAAFEKTAKRGDAFAEIKLGAE